MATRPLENKHFSLDLYEDVPCDFCGSSSLESEVIFASDPTKIPKAKDELLKIYSSASSQIFFEQAVRCKKCGLIYLSPRAKQELIVKSYSLAEDKQYVSQEKGRSQTFKNCLKAIQGLCRSGNLLDVGAASGIFVRVARDAGYDALGVEPSKWLCEFARKNYAVKMFCGVLEEAKLPDKSFDIVTLWDVLEHVASPGETLKEINRILKPGGLLVINYPRIDDFLARLSGRHWWFLLSVHLYYFTPKTLTAYLDKHGFKRISHKMHFQKLSYDYLASRLEVYSKPLAKIARFPYAFMPIKEMLLPYFASQYLMIARKKDE
ncbi:MAG: class I SAM-dependent methyltransferase [Candidatus Omnitrophica bacterium]|jgi:ubiquinone/menaquinone biosynthesis C-methylase UbiE|nr:class I SAM-dependent methyltransferase [Candidatus Omnitrophota bacterium]